MVIISIILNKFHLQENMQSILSHKLARYSYQKYLLTFELKDQIKYINNTFLILLDNQLASVRNKALESVKAYIMSYLEDSSGEYNEYGSTMMECIEDRLEFLTESKNPSTRYNALDIISCILDGATNGHCVTKVNLEVYVGIAVECLNDTSPRVRKKAIDIVCNILEAAEKCTPELGFILQKGICF